ncbi:MAG: hypothetical protein U0U66_02865 [Cytophagaceae bacterium]
MSCLKILFFLSTTLVFLLGCTSYDIIVKRDGSAHVTIVMDGTPAAPTPSDDGFNDNDSLSFNNFKPIVYNFYQSSLIKNLKIDTTKNERITIVFDIDKIDSLGKYLSPLIPYPVIFKLTNNRLFIIGSDGKSDPEDDIGGYTNLLTFKMNLKFEKTIKSIKTENSYIKRLDNNTIQIESSIGEMNYSVKLNQLIVELE